MLYLKKNKSIIQLTDGSTMLFFFISKQKYFRVDSDLRSCYLCTKLFLSITESVSNKYKNLFLLNLK